MTWQIWKDFFTHKKKENKKEFVYDNIYNSVIYLHKKKLSRLLYSNHFFSYKSILEYLSNDHVWMTSFECKPESTSFLSNFLSFQYFEWKETLNEKSVHDSVINEFKGIVKKREKALYFMILGSTSRNDIDNKHAVFEMIFFNLDNEYISIHIKDITLKLCIKTIIKNLIEWNIEHILQHYPLDQIIYLFLEKDNENSNHLIHENDLRRSNTTINISDTERRRSSSSYAYTKLMKNTGLVFLDIVGFTCLSNNMDTCSLFMHMNNFYEEIDMILEKYDFIRKIEIAGDSYVCITYDEENGTFDDDYCNNYLNHLFCFCKDILDIVEKKFFCDIRIGFHFGDVNCGIIGKYQPKFTIIGTPMIITSRLQTTSYKNSIHMLKSTFKRIEKMSNITNIEERYHVYLKGLGMENTIQIF